jgi:hypothetical protein
MQLYEPIALTTDVYRLMVTSGQMLCTGQPYLHLSLVKPMAIPFILGQDQIRGDNNNQNTVQVNHPQGVHVLHTSTPSLPTCTPVAELEAHGATCQPDPWYYQQAQTVTSTCVCS